MDTTERGTAMWTILDITTGEAINTEGEPVLFDSYEAAATWAATAIDPDQASELVITEI